jgi:anaerobic selenocysteine-containing dehydrogenase
MDRRDFIKVSSLLTAGSTVLTSCGKTMRQTIAQTIPDDQMVIGEERRVASVCNGCGAGCGLEVRWVDGRAIKLEGAPDHPVNRGRLCARGQAELQLLYNPDRIRGPLENQRPVEWENALSALADKLKSTDPKGIAFLTPRLSGMRARVIDDFLERIGAPPRVEAEPLSEAAVRHAQVTADFENCNYVLSFGAPLVEGGSSLVRQQRGLAHMRQGRPGLRGKLVQVESRYSLTAAYADEWIYVPPGTEGALALALANAPRWDYERAAAITGLKVDRIERLAREFRQYQPSVAVIGGSAAGHSNSTATADAVAQLNAVSKDGTKNNPWRPEPQPGRVRSLEDIAGQPELQQVVLVTGRNPLYEFPGAIAPSAFVVSFSPFPDETTTSAPLVLPNHTALEAWHESQSAKGTIVVKPAVMPLYQTRDIGDVLLDVSARLGKNPPQASWQEMLDTTFSQERAAPAPPRAKPAWEPPVFQGTGEFYLQVYGGVSLGLGDAANVPWLQELPDPLSQTVWASAVEMNPRTAARLGLQDGDAVVVESPKGRVPARLMVNPAAAPNLVAMAAGQGHTALGRYAENRGANAFALIDRQHWAATRVTVTKA